MLARADRFLAPRRWPPNPQPNQAEFPAPSHSVEGTKLRLAILCGCAAQDTPQTATRPERGRHDWRGGVVRDQTPLYVSSGYRDFIGVFVARAARTVPVMSAIRYGGILPMTEQPILQKPDAWSDPERGSP